MSDIQSEPQGRSICICCAQTMGGNRPPSRKHPHLCAPCVQWSELETGLSSKPVVAHPNGRWTEKKSNFTDGAAGGMDAA